MKVFKQLLIILFFVVFASVVTSYFKDNIFPSKPIENKLEKSQTTVKIVFEDKEFESTYELSEDSNAFSLLQRIAEENDIEIVSKQYDFGVFVQSIDGLESNADMSWIYFINGESGQVAADQMKLKDKDIVEWKYIKPEYES